MIGLSTPDGFEVRRHSESASPHWPRYVLLAAAGYNIAWGLFVVLFPAALFVWTGIEPPRYPAIWQCVGMIVGVYGLGYLIAASDPMRHWPIVLVGLLGKLFGPFGFLVSAAYGQLPWNWGLTIVTNDLIWWWPFAAILYLSFRHHTAATREGVDPSGRRVSDTLRSQRGATVGELASSGPLLLVFLRHSGCAFCREMLADLVAQRAEIESRGVRIALVHMSSLLKGTQLAYTFGLEHLHRFSDPQCRLYREFGLERGRWWQLFGPNVWCRAVEALWKGCSVGPLDGDGFQMPGVFLLRKGRVVAEFRHRSAADRPDYLSLLGSPSPTVPLSSPSVPVFGGAAEPVSR